MHGMCISTYFIPDPIRQLFKHKTLYKEELSTNI